MKSNKPVIFGLLGGLALLSIYFIILSIANSFEHVIEQFKSLWYFIILIVAGFGIQIGFFVYIKEYIKVKKSETSIVAASGGVSTASMIACCAHHLSEVLPLIVLSAAALFLLKYQLFFIILAVLSNLIGINLLLKHIQNHHLYDKRSFLAKILKLNMKKIFNYNIIGSIIILAIVVIKLIK